MLKQDQFSAVLKDKFLKDGVTQGHWILSFVTGSENARGVDEACTVPKVCVIKRFTGTRAAHTH